MKEIIDLVLFTLIFIGLLFPMLYYTIKETEEARQETREFVKEYYAHLERTEQNQKHRKIEKNEQTINENN